ncbi:MAG: hypothetical protein ACJ8AH_02405 [Stellaceae bacterium]
MTVSLLVLGSPVKADDFSINAPPVGSDHLPKKGSATYSGMYALSGAWSGVTGPVQLYVDFGTDRVIADLTIPPLGAPGSQTPETHFTPTGDISLNKKEPATYVLTEGVAFSPDQPFINMSGSFSGPRGRNPTGTLTGTICVPLDIASPARWVALA